MKNLIVVLLLIVILFLTGRWLAGHFTKNKKLTPLSASKFKPACIAHRGGSEEWPENTLLAFEKSVELGCDAIETDLHQTQDGEFVIFHDETIERTTNGTGEIKNFTLAELKKLDAAYNFSQDGGKTFPYRGRGIQTPELKEVLQKLPNTVFILEVKDPDLDLLKFIKVVKELGAFDRVYFTSFVENVLSNLRSAEPSAVSGFAHSEVKKILYFYYLKLLPFYKPVGQSLQVPPSHEGRAIVTKDWVTAMHKKGLEVLVWTINEESEMKTLIDQRVDGIMTDRPTLLKKVLAENKL